jgi:hypothetical protein
MLDFERTVHIGLAEIEAWAQHELPMQRTFLKNKGKRRTFVSLIRPVVMRSTVCVDDTEPTDLDEFIQKSVEQIHPCLHFIGGRH